MLIAACHCSCRCENQLKWNLAFCLMQSGPTLEYLVISPYWLKSNIYRQFRPHHLKELKQFTDINNRSVTSWASSQGISRIFFSSSSSSSSSGSAVRTDFPDSLSLPLPLSLSIHPSRPSLPANHPNYILCPYIADLSTLPRPSFPFTEETWNKSY